MLSVVSVIDYTFMATISHFLEAKKIGKLKIIFTKIDSYFGKIKLTFKNIDRHITLVKKTTVNIRGMYSSQGEDCCQKTFPFSSKGSFDGDETSLIITGNDKGWTFANSFHTGTITIVATLNDQL